MLFLVIIGICVTVVPLAGGRLAALTEVEWRRSWLIVGALALQILIVSIFPGAPRGLNAAAHVLSYFLAAAFVAANASVPGIWLIAVGGLLNLLAIAANGGVMPASASALAAAGMDGLDPAFSNSALVADAKLSFLGDIFAVPKGLPLSNVFSIGDVGIAAGAAVGVLGICCRRPGAQRQARPSPSRSSGGIPALPPAAKRTNLPRSEARSRPDPGR